MACPSSCSINRHLLPVKASYYFTLAAVASLLPYLAVYMKHLGLSPSETAIIYGTMPFLGALMRPVFGGLADKFHKHKEILMVVSVLSGGFHACLLAVPAVPSSLPLKTSVQLSCGEVSFIKYCGAVQHDNQYCQQTSLSFFLKSHMWHLYNPFFNASGCILQCDWQQVQPSWCLVNEATSKICADTFRPETVNSTQFEVFFKTLNHFDSLQSGNDNAKPVVCSLYGLTDFIYNGSDFHNLTCSESTLIDCHLSCDELPNHDLNENCVKISKKQPRYSTTFWGFFVIMFLANIAFAPVFSLIDAMTYDFLGEERGKWGKQRLWGTVGFALHGLASGFIMDMFSNSGREFLFAFVCFAFFEIVTAVVVCQYRISSSVACGSMMSNMRSLLSRLDIVALFIIIFIFGMFTGVIETFLYWYLTGLGATKTLFGLCMFLNCLPEILIFYLSGIIMKHISQVRCLYIVCLAYALRFFGYSILKNPWIVLSIEPLHSITYGLMYASATSYGSIITPAGMHGTVQGLIGGLHFGFGKGCGSVLGGQVYEAFGAIVLFRSCAVASLVALIAYFCAQQYLGFVNRRRSSDTEKELKDLGGTPEEKGEMLPNSEDPISNGTVPNNRSEEL